MNQGRIWCVVNPTVGLPLFLGSVAGIALIVHYSVLSNTTWFSSYWNGGAKKSASVENTGQPVASNGAGGFVITVSPSKGAAPNAETSFVVSVAPQQAVPAKPDQLALASPTK